MLVQRGRCVDLAVVLVVVMAVVVIVVVVGVLVTRVVIGILIQTLVLIINVPLMGKSLRIALEEKVSAVGP